MQELDKEVYELSWGADLIVIYKQYWSASLRRHLPVTVEGFTDLLGRFWDDGIIVLRLQNDTESSDKKVVLDYIIKGWNHEDGWEDDADGIELLIFLETLGELEWLSKTKPPGSEATRKAIYDL